MFEYATSRGSRQMDVAFKPTGVVRDGWIVEARLYY
jgi:hypothetical protein